MAVYFDNPNQFNTMRNKFSPREVGITHPDTQAFFKLADNGDAQLMVSEDMGIILSPSTGTIFFIAKSISFLTNEEAGIKWNGKLFNRNGTVFSEPFLIPAKPHQIYEDFDGLLE